MPDYHRFHFFLDIYLRWVVFRDDINPPYSAVIKGSRDIRVYIYAYIAEIYTQKRMYKDDMKYLKFGLYEMQRQIETSFNF